MISSAPFSVPAVGTFASADVVSVGVAHDVKDAFDRSIAENFGASQAIIFENEDPRSVLGADANIIRFAGTSHGRRGFIPKSV